MPTANDPFEGRTVLVTGGCGFLGSRVVERLVACGARVRVLDRLSQGPPTRLAPSVELVRCVLGQTPPEDLEAPLSGVEYVFHFAAEKHSQERPDAAAILQTNVAGTWALVEAAARAGVRKVVFASSLYACGRMTAPALREDEPSRPTTVYGISKLAGEGLLEHAWRARSLASVALRYFFVYGPGQRAGQGYRSVVWSNLQRLIRREPLVVRGDGEQTLDYVYVDDAVEAALVAMAKDVSGEVLNVGSGRGVTINRLTEMMLSLEAGGRTTSAPADETAGTSRVADIEKIGRLLGWAPKVALEEGLARTHAWLAREVVA
jgi:UDP-glucose 4-epimerase